MCSGDKVGVRVRGSFIPQIRGQELYERGIEGHYSM